jgi:hypothetical protein
MAGSDVKAIRLTSTGSAGVGPARIRQIQVLTDDVGAGRLTVTDGNGGATALDIDFNIDDSHSVNIPDEGIRVSDIYVSVETNITAMTVFYS